MEVLTLHGNELRLSWAKAFSPTTRMHCAYVKVAGFSYQIRLLISQFFLIFMFAQAGAFNAINARTHLRKLTGFGPRPAGSYANDIQALAFLRFVNFNYCPNMITFQISDLVGWWHGVAGFFVFSQQLLICYFRLGYVRVNDCLAGLKPYTGARNRKMATVKIRSNPSSLQTD